MEEDKVKDLGQVPECIKDYVRDVVLEGESILPYICDMDEEKIKESIDNEEYN